MRLDTDEEPICVDLHDDAACDPALVGSKAAQLARAGRAGLPVVPGMIITTPAIARLQAGLFDLDALDALLGDIWRSFGGPHRSVIVRSSSVIEDTADSSMAGRFTTVLDVAGVAELRDAVEVVARRVPEGVDNAMAVLVQPMVRARFGGVAFSADPTTGDTGRVVVAAVRGGPDQLVSGAVTGAHYVLTRRGAVRSQRDPVEGLARGDLRRVARLAACTTTLGGWPQDIEWAIDHDGSLLLLQSRPITTLPVGRRNRSRDTVYGPGPIAETFPEPLSRLEQDLWLRPIETAIDAAIGFVGVRRPRRAPPTVVAIGGRVAVDLERLGVRRRRTRDLLDPRVAVRRLAAAWRVGRLRTVLPDLVEAQIETVDAQLAAVPALGHLDDRELLTVLDRSAIALIGLHGYEVLAALLRDDPATVSLAAVALATAQLGRHDGIADDDLAEAHPVTLALSPPKIARTAELPPLPPSDLFVTLDDRSLNARESMRLRVRWVHELSARAAFELGARLAERGLLDDAEAVRHVSHGDLRRAVESGQPQLLQLDAVAAGPALPAEFRLAPDGSVIDARAGDPVRRRDASTNGLAASPGRAEGIAWDGHGVAPAPAVLVVRTLDPRLATVLSECVAIVAETGNVLSHLAILAREYRVPAVVAYPGAVEAFANGTHLSVDGTTGRVTITSAPHDRTPTGAPA